MKTITRADLIPVITGMVKKHPGADTTGMMWDGRGDGACFVGTLLDTYGVSLREEDNVKVFYTDGDFALSSTYLSNMVEGMLYKYIFQVGDGERFRFDEELTADINRSIALNDGQVPWEIIARQIWNIEVQPDPLAPKEPIKPIKIVTDPPVTTKKNLYEHYFTQINHYGKDFSKLIGV